MSLFDPMDIVPPLNSPVNVPVAALNAPVNVPPPTIVNAVPFQDNLSSRLNRP